MPRLNFKKKAVMGEHRNASLISGVLGFLLIILASASIMFVSGGSVIVFFLLLLPLYVCEEWLGSKLFGDGSPLDRFSTARNGFSLFRVLGGSAIGATILIFGLTAICGKEFLWLLIGR